MLNHFFFMNSHCVLNIKIINLKKSICSRFVNKMEKWLQNCKKYTFLTVNAYIFINYAYFFNKMKYFTRFSNEKIVKIIVILCEVVYN